MDAAFRNGKAGTDINGHARAVRIIVLCAKHVFCDRAGFFLLISHFRSSDSGSVRLEETANSLYREFDGAKKPHYITFKVKKMPKHFRRFTNTVQGILRVLKNPLISKSSQISWQ